MLSLNQQFCTRFEIIRRSCSVKNMEYSVRAAQNLEYAIELCKQMVTSRKTLVFVMSKSHCERVAGLLDCNCYHADLDEIDKEEILKKFNQFDTGILVTTSTLSSGIDLMNVNQVIHIEGSYSLIDYIQETGRGGRNGQVCRAVCIIIVSKTSAEENMKTYTRNEQNICRRAIITNYIDGFPLFCLQNEDFQKCDICARSTDSIPLIPVENVDFVKHSLISGSDPITKTFGNQLYDSKNYNLIQLLPVKNTNLIESRQSSSSTSGSIPKNINGQVSSTLMKAYTNVSAEVVMKFKETLTSIASFGCILCSIFDSVKVKHVNGLASCPHVTATRACLKCLNIGLDREYTYHPQKECRFKNMPGCCFKCGLPPKASNIKLHHDGEGFSRNDPCRYMDILVPLSWIIKREQSMKWTQLCQEFAIARNISDEDYFTWMLNTRDFHGLPNMAKVLQLALSNNWIRK